MPDSAPTELREVFNGLRYVIESGAPWPWIPHDLPSWIIVYRQTRRALLRFGAGRGGQPSVALLDSRTLQVTPESGERTG